MGIRDRQVCVQVRVDDVEELGELLDGHKQEGTQVARVGAVEVVAKGTRSVSKPRHNNGARNTALQVPFLMGVKFVEERTGLLKSGSEHRLKGMAGEPTASY